VDIHMFMPNFNAMREELTRIGFTELKTPEEVMAQLPTAKGTTLLAINSMCGCAGGIARPGVALALQNGVKVDHLYTVFAGQDKEATAAARSLFPEYPPSSPSFAVLKDGKIVTMIHRHQIEGSSPQAVAARIADAVQQAQA
jgi:putative YphP/YqiW family bacilliredoxin